MMKVFFFLNADFFFLRLSETEFHGVFPFFFSPLNIRSFLKEIIFG